MAFVDLPAPHGKLEGLLWEAPSPRAAVVVCHPHPKGGGTMHNHVTYRLADAFRAHHVSTLRFNFRGVGRSTGTHDDGRGEVDDARAALDFLEARVPGVPLFLAGFSFGSRVALELSVRDARVERCLFVGIAVDLFDYSALSHLTLPKAFVHAERDEYGKLERVKAVVEATPPPHALFVVPDADHLCVGRLDAFLVQAKAAVGWLLGAAAPPRKPGPEGG